MQYKKEMRKEIKQGKIIAKIAGKHIIDLTNDHDNHAINKKYPYLLPNHGEKQSIFVYIKALFQPCEADLKLVDIPDSLFFIYYLIHPIYKIWRITPFYHSDSIESP